MTNTELSKLKEGDKILFNSRKTPLKVEKAGNEEILVEGPKGGKYQIYKENDTLLVSDADSRKYSSYCKNLRKVGKWQKKKPHKYKHSKTGAKLQLKQLETGYWKIKTGIKGNTFENPLYGFSDKEEALKQLKKIKRKNPEGK